MTEIASAGGWALAAILALKEVALAALGSKRNGTSESTVIAQALERQAAAVEGLLRVMESVAERLQEQGEALRRVEIGQVRVEAAINRSLNGRRDT